jgi:hypothetical protein
MTIYIEGNGNNIDFTFTDSVTNDWFTLGNGLGDFVEATANDTTTSTAPIDISYDLITLGNGAGDFVQVAATADANANANGAASATATATAGGSISHDIITLGNGAGDFVEVATAHAHATETASASSPVGSPFSLGFGTLATGPAVGDISNDVITFGNGAGDFVLDNGNISNDIITFRDNAATTSPDYVQAFGNISNNTITFGNGNGDNLTVQGSGAGGDVIVTGTGLDTVTVGAHTNADTFGFSLGTNVSSYTTINGAQVGDLVTSGNSLGNIVSNSTNYATLTSFIASLTPSNGHTYIDNNGTDTFIVTDSGSHIGAIEIVGSFTGTVANHVLTLHAAEMAM